MLFRSEILQLNTPDDFICSTGISHSVRELCNYVFSSLNLDYREYVKDLVRPGQDLRYSIDDGKLKQLGWQARANFDKELAKIVEYYRKTFVW